VDVEFLETRDERSERARFEWLFRQHYPEILRYAARRVDSQTALEVAAETFVVAWRRRDDVPVDGARAWLYAVARRVLANELRSGDRRGRLIDRLQTVTTTSGAPPTASDLAQGVVDRDEVRALLGRLAAPAREALELVEWDGLSVAEAARVVGCSVGAFRVRLHRARRRLLELYGQAGGRAGTDRSGPAPVGAPTSTGKERG
jgi:RNA polymerase sigma-70 factor (ECF subfamily)